MSIYTKYVFQNQYDFVVHPENFKSFNILFMIMLCFFKLLFWACKKPAAKYQSDMLCFYLVIRNIFNLLKRNNEIKHFLVSWVKHCQDIIVFWILIIMNICTTYTSFIKHSYIEYFVCQDNKIHTWLIVLSTTDQEPINVNSVFYFKRPPIYQSVC